MSKQSSHISTEDEQKELKIPQCSKFACEMIAANNSINFQQRCQLTSKEIFDLLLHNRSNFDKILNIQSLKYVTTDTKAQYSFLVMLCYLYWLSQMQKFIHKNDSTLTKRYNIINCTYISMTCLAKLDSYLASEKEKINETLYKCAKSVHNTLHLATGQGKYFPLHFRENVSNVALTHYLDFSKCKFQQLIKDVQHFFAKRVKKEYDYMREGNQDQTISIIESISSSFI